MRQMAAPSGRSPRPGPPAKRIQKGDSPSRPVPVVRPRSYAAIDLGTNNCRLLIARPQDGELVVIDAFSRIVRLGEGLHATGRISDAAMDRTVAALAICADKLRRRHVTLSRAVATEACRRASNGAELAARILGTTPEALALGPGLPATPATLEGVHAMATVLLASPTAEALLERLRGLLGPRDGASAWNGKLIARCVAEDSLALRKTLVQVLSACVGPSVMPKVWSL